MYLRITILICLTTAALASAWYLNRLTTSASKTEDMVYHDPDYYMEDFTTLTMNQNGTPKNKLYAVYMAHYPENDTTELLKPKMEFFRTDRPPVYVIANKGWIAENNEVILLEGDVELWQHNIMGTRTLQVNTSEAQVLPNAEYAESDKFTTIISGRSTITGTGMRAHFEDGRLEVLSDVHTTIEPRQTL